MTNEKAIDLLRRMQEPEAYEPQITEEAFEALELAIRALGTDTNVGAKDAPNINAGDMISRSSLLAKYDEEHEGPPGRARKLIEDEPAAQPEIVRCKDCQHYEYGICKKAGLCVNKSQNGFCDWAEKREVNHESN